MDREKLDEALVELLEAGLIEVEYTENLEAAFKTTPKGKALVEHILKGLK
jgi:predicted transcriptional regulator